MSPLATRRSPTNGSATPSVSPIAVGCYARQSVDRGDSYGSISAQRDAIESFVASQRGNGWYALPDRYDDGGYSGKDTDRPAFQRLMRDVEAGKVLVLATYRLDRLSRSQRDFFEIMDFLERHGATFVSISEQFNTTTSQGRFALSISIAVAQLEREVTSQRTKDKIAASRRRGLWTGGRPCLGLDSIDGRLVVNPSEAERVRGIFKTFIECGSVIAVVEELRRCGWTSKTWRNKRGELVVGRPFDKGSLRRLLGDVLYRGRIRLGDEVFDAAHEAIVDQRTWDAAQALLAKRERARPPRPGGRQDALLRGLLRCAACGSAMPHHFASKAGRRYGAYVCLKYTKEGAAACPGARVAVGEIEGFVVDRIRAIGTDPGLVRDTIATAKAQLAAAGPRIESELRQVAADRARLDAERKNLIAAIGANGEGSASQVARVAEIDAAVTGLDQRAQELRGERAALEGQAIDEDDLRAALAEFDGLWNALAPAERSRLLHLLVEEVRFDGRSDQVEITFRPGGVRGLADQSRRNGA